ALGVTVYTLVFGCAPFIALSIIELNEKIAQQPVDYSIRGEMSRDDDFDDVIDLLRRMLERDAEKRISATELVKHKFIFRKRSGTTTTTLSPSAAASKRDDDKNFPLKLPHPNSSANGVVPVISIDAIRSGPATSSLLDGKSYSSPQQKSPSSGVHEQSSDSFGEITAEETYTAFTPLLPRPPPLVVGLGVGGGYRREFAAFGGFLTTSRSSLNFTLETVRTFSS
ncbi:protein kinase, putative, partial [Bodo saltans]